MTLLLWLVAIDSCEKQNGVSCLQFLSAPTESQALLLKAGHAVCWAQLLIWMEYFFISLVKNPRAAWGSKALCTCSGLSSGGSREAPNNTPGLTINTRGFTACLFSPPPLLNPQPPHPHPRWLPFPCLPEKTYLLEPNN